MKRIGNLLFMLSVLYYVSAQTSVTPIPDYTSIVYPGVGCEYTGVGSNAGERKYTDGVQTMLTEFPASPLNDFVDCRDFDRIDGTVAGEVGAVIGYNSTGSTDTGGGEIYKDITTVTAQLRYNGGSKGWRGKGQWAFYTVQFPEVGSYDFYVGIKANQNFGYAIYKKETDGKLSIVSALKQKSTTDDCTAQGTGWGTGSDAFLVNDEALTVSNTEDQYVVMLVSGDAIGSIGSTNGQFGGFTFVKQSVATDPSVELTSPANNSNTMIGGTINLSATATAVAGTTISSVDFIINGASYGGTPTQSGDDWSDTYVLPSAGSYLVQASTINSKGEKDTTEVYVVTAGTDYPFYSYFAGAVDTAFQATDTLTEAHLIDKWNELYMCDASHFDKVSSGVASMDQDAGVTFIEGDVKSPVSFTNHPRSVVETTYNTSIGFNSNPYSIENTLGMTFYYTVEFAKAGKYQLAARTRGGNGSQFAVSLMEYKEINNANEVVNLDFNAGGLSIASANGDLGTSNCSYIGLAKTPNLASGQANSVWVKITSSITIDASITGKYLLKVQHLAGGNGSSFSGFAFLPDKNTTVAIERVDICEKAYVSDRRMVVELNAATKSQLSVYNLSGQCLYNDQFSTSRIVSEKSFVPGIYLLKVATEEAQKTYKIVVQ